MMLVSSDDRDRTDMASLAAGREAALNDLMERHGEKLFHYLIRSLQNEDEAADLAQETFVRVYQNCAKFDPAQKFSTWLYAIAGNMVRDYYRSRVRHPQVVAGWSVGGGTAVDLASHEHLAGLVIVGTSTKIGDVVRNVAANHAPWSWFPGWLLSLMASDCKFDSLAKIPTVSCPILIINSSADELVPKDMAEKLAAASKTKVTRFTIDGARHKDIFRVGGAPLWSAIDDWLRSACP